jgi:hypothetical protein
MRMMIQQIAKRYDSGAAFMLRTPTFAGKRFSVAVARTAAVDHTRRRCI